MAFQQSDRRRAARAAKNNRNWPAASTGTDYISATAATCAHAVAPRGARYRLSATWFGRIAELLVTGHNRLALLQQKGPGQRFLRVLHAGDWRSAVRQVTDIRRRPWTGESLPYGYRHRPIERTANSVPRPRLSAEAPCRGIRRQSRISAGRLRPPPRKLARARL